MFNARERAALYGLVSTLIIGLVTVWLAERQPGTLEEFRIERAVVDVPRVEQTSPFVDLNGASVEQLQQLPLIGEKTAARIVEYRRVHGPFSTLEQLRNVKGIGAVTLQKVEPLLQVK